MGFFSKTHFLLHHFYTIPACTFIALYNISYTRRFVEAQYLLGFVGSHGVAKTYETRQSDYMQFPVDSSKPVCLFFDFAKVSVLSTPDQSASMYVRYYGKNSVDDLSSLPYAEQEDGALHLGLHLPDQNSFTEITVEIYLPMAKYTALNAEVGVGSLTVENMQFGALVSSVKVGNTCLKRTSADSVKLVAATGNLAWEDGSRVLKSLSMHTEVGNIQLAWATGDGFRLAYQIGSGKLKNQFEGAVTEQTGSQHASSKGTLTSGDESRAIELSASTGDISLTSFSTKE